MRKRPVPVRSKRLSDYWVEFYTNNGLCSLCANSGIVDTTGISTPAGTAVGRKNFCICPNGQTIRDQRIKISKKRSVLP